MTNTNTMICGTCDKVMDAQTSQELLSDWNTTGGLGDFGNWVEGICEDCGSETFHCTEPVSQARKGRAKGDWLNVLGKLWLAVQTLATCGRCGKLTSVFAPSGTLGHLLNYSETEDNTPENVNLECSACNVSDAPSRDKQPRRFYVTLAEAVAIFRIGFAYDAVTGSNTMSRLTESNRAENRVPSELRQALEYARRTYTLGMTESELRKAELIRRAEAEPSRF